MNQEEVASLLVQVIRKWFWKSWLDPQMMFDNRSVKHVSIIQALFDHNDWANHRLLQFCAPLAADPLD
ncbi:MAG: hypothetical protein JNL67_04815 [Planctomycetaceae bacterium]|nr:hypothetical protein [Planctomycetaceae bacterium]